MVVWYVDIDGLSSMVEMLLIVVMRRTSRWDLTPFLYISVWLCSSQHRRLVAALPSSL
jgi:hypothetical protein